MKKPIAVIDLYCGLGGFTQGAIEAGATVILSIDSWDEAIKVHKKNHPGIPCWNLKLGTSSDWKLIKKVMNKYPNYHIHIHGSPPCQALSNASSTDSEKGMVLVNHFLDMIEKLKPDSWSMENVVPLKKKLPENINSVILNSADFSVPQTRRRCYAGSGWEAEPTKSKNEWISVIEALPHLSDEVLTHINMVGASDSNSKRARSSDVNINKPSKTLTNQRPTFRVIKLESLGSNSNRNRDTTILEPSKTICGSGNQVGARIFNHETKPTKIRSLTLGETLVLQGFSPNYDLSDANTMKSRWTMCGNAVPPPVASAVVRGINNGKTKL
jgi:site-specific DNA-cytosine methylase